VTKNINFKHQIFQLHIFKERVRMKFSKKFLVQIVLLCSLCAFSTNNFIQGMGGENNKKSADITCSTTTSSSTTVDDLFFDVSDNPKVKEYLKDLLHEICVKQEIAFILKLSTEAKEFKRLFQCYSDSLRVNEINFLQKDLVEPLKEQLNLRINELLIKLSDNKLIEGMRKLAKKKASNNSEESIESNIYFVVVEKSKDKLEAYCSFFGKYLKPYILEQESVASYCLKNPKTILSVFVFCAVLTHVITWYISQSFCH
jgi:hypothetical protein